jgi:DNA-binding MurR/RpiR family transcriptional regulator
MPPNQHDTEGSCLARVRAFVRDASAGQAKVGQAVLDAPAEARSMAISDLAEASGTSAATVSRFCKRLGYESYRAFQLGLATALAQGAQNTLDDFVAGSPPDVVARRVFQINRESLEDTERLVNMDHLVRVGARIANADRVYLFGLGGSSLVARDGAQRFMSLGLTAIPVVDPHEQVFASANVTKEDVVIAISHTGQTSHVCEAARTASVAGATTAAITNYPGAPLAAICDFLLATAFREHRINAAVSSSRVAQLCLVDSLYFMIASWVPEGARQLADRAEERVQGILRQIPGSSDSGEEAE